MINKQTKPLVHSSVEMAQNTPMQQRVAEKLIILNEHGSGMLVRIYSIKKELAEQKPDLLKDKSIQTAVEKVFLKKFPSYDSKASQLSVVNQKKEEIIQELSVFYVTFVELMTLKDHIVELLTTIDALQIHCDISLNYDFTKNYLDLIVTYVTLMILLSQIDDRKAVLSLYNNAFEFKNNKSDSSYHRLGQMFIDYDSPLKKLSDEFVPHARHVIPALVSLHNIYIPRNLSADDLRKYQFLSMFTDSVKMASIPTTDMIQCEFLSFDTLERWIVYGFLVCHQGLMDDAKATDLWKLALQSNLTFTIFRSDILFYSDIINFFESLKGQSKRITEVKELQNNALQTAPNFHKERRKFLRNALRDLCLAFTEQPGLFGPKALYVFQALSFGRDEVVWLLRHIYLSTCKKQNIKITQEDFSDRHLPELIFYMEELKDLTIKYKTVIQSYYGQYLSGYDSVVLNNLLPKTCPSDDLTILTSFLEILNGLSDSEKYEDNTFQAFRLDWLRLQVSTSGSKAGLELKSHEDLAKHLNTVVFHTKLMDSLEEMLEENSDLSLYCFHTKLLEYHFNQCMEFLPQHRYSIAFPLISRHFMRATHSFCPEERISIGKTVLKYIHWFIRYICNEIGGLITKICAEIVEMDKKLLPQEAVAVALYQHQKNREKENKDKEKKQDKRFLEPQKPGAESFRKYREQMTLLDKLYIALTDLCFALNCTPIVHAWHHGFVPREILFQTLEVTLNKAFVDLLQLDTETKAVVKPSEVLCAVQSYMTVLQNVGNFVQLDISQLIKKVLLEQSQPVDSNGEKTLTFHYMHWYNNVLMNHVLANLEHITFSPSKKSMIVLPHSHVEPMTSAVENYINIHEIKALVELIGPYGMKCLDEKLIQFVSFLFDDMKKLVKSKKDILTQARTCFDKSGILDQINLKLMDADIIIEKMIKIGLILEVHSLIKEALNDVLTQRIPFLLGSIEGFQNNFHNKKSPVVNELLSSAGISCSVDLSLVHALHSVHSSADSNQEEYDAACLLFVYLALSLFRLAYWEQTTFKVSLGAHANSSHCLAKSINQVAGALFSLYGPGDISMRLNEFLDLASTSLLHLSQQNDKESSKNRESVYLILDQIVRESPFLTMDQLEQCFPYALLRNAYHGLYKTSSEL